MLALGGITEFGFLSISCKFSENKKRNSVKIFLAAQVHSGFSSLPYNRVTNPTVSFVMYQLQWGQVGSGQVRSGQVRSGQVRSLCRPPTIGAL